MRSPRLERFRLSFALPKAARPIPSGNFTGWVKDCEFSIAGPFVAILGPSRERVMDQGARLVRIACYRMADVDIAATIESPPPLSGRDNWTIIVNADVAFAPTGLGATFPEISDSCGMISSENRSPLFRIMP